MYGEDDTVYNCFKREIRGDGSCYFTSMWVGMIEAAIVSATLREHMFSHFEHVLNNYLTEKDKYFADREHYREQFVSIRNSFIMLVQGVYGYRILILNETCSTKPTLCILNLILSPDALVIVYIVI